MEKKCTKCKVSKGVDNFPNDPRSIDGKRIVCKECRKISLTPWIPIENEILNCKICKEGKIYTLFSLHGKQKPYQCKQCRNKICRNNKNKEEYNKKQREDWVKHNEKRNASRRKNLQHRRDTDHVYCIKMSLHVRLYDAVKRQKGIKSAKTIELIGCQVDELLEHLGSQFTEGMTWENYGQWHIDHIRPCASFDLTDLEQQKICFHWTNLQPLWATDNIKKGSKYDPVPLTECTLGRETRAVE
jgi:hypothetical protein